MQRYSNLREWVAHCKSQGRSDSLFYSAALEAEELLDLIEHMDRQSKEEQLQLFRDEDLFRVDL